MQSNYQHNINNALKELADTKNISSALLVCNTLLEYMGIETKSIEDIELSKLKLPNAERYDRWFDAHPHFRGDRACFDLTPKDTMLEAKFYTLQKRSRLFIAGAVNFTPNFEDRDYTRSDPNMKVGIDFFFTPERDSIIVVLSNKGSLRLVELSDMLTNTQNEIFTIWHNVSKTEDKNLFHMTLWESFKLSSLNKKFYEGISNSFISLTHHLKDNAVEEQLANQFANRLLGRLLFLWFLRKKNIINEAKEYFNTEGFGDDEYYRTKLKYLFFDILNTEIKDRDSDQKIKNTLFGVEKDNPTLFASDSITPYLNGGLFDQNSDGEYWNTNKPTFPAGFFRTLYDHFDSFNFTTDESTPEYEQIAIDPEMLGRIFESFLATLTTETGAQAKKANGAFYTPREIVSYMSRESLRQYLYTALDAGEILKTSIDDLLDRPDSEWALAGTNSKRDTVAKEDRERIMDALRAIKVLDPAVGSGAFPMGVLHKILSLFERLEPNFDSYETKLSILKNNIYGVDIDPTAIEISRLRAWLSIIVDVKDIKKIKPLPNLDFKFVCANSLISLHKGEASLSSDANLKPELIRIRDEYYATSSKVKKEKLQKEYIKLTHKDSLFDTEETRQLKSYKPFENGRSASFYDPELMHGVDAFDVIIGNPPYVNIFNIKDKIYRDYVKKKYSIYKNKTDLYAFFTERGYDLLKPDGVLYFIISNSWLGTDSFVKLREFLVFKTKVVSLVKCYSDVFEASVTTVILGIKKEEVATHEITLSEFDGQFKSIPHKLTYNQIKNQPSFGFTFNIPLILKIDSKRLESICDFSLGIKTSDDKRFISDQKISDEYYPILRGKDTDSYSSTFNSKYIWYRPDLMIEKMGAGPRKKEIFENNKKILVKDIAQNISATIDTDGYFTTDTLNIIYNPKENYSLELILGLLNSSFVRKWFKVSFPAGLHIKLNQLKQVPIPTITKDNKDIVEKIASLVSEILLVKKIDSQTNTKVDEKQIDSLVFKLYELNEEEIKIIETQK